MGFMMMRSKTKFKNLNHEYKDLCKLIKKSVRETITDYEKWIVTENKNNPKLIKLIKTLATLKNVKNIWYRWYSTFCNSYLL